jgi:formylmethanofuran dehydrogenase subunit E
MNTPKLHTHRIMKLGTCDRCGERKSLLKAEEIPGSVFCSVWCAEKQLRAVMCVE